MSSWIKMIYDEEVNPNLRSAFEMAKTPMAQ